MAINLTITVADISATITLGYTHIRVYRSAEYDAGFLEITTTDTLIELVPGVSTYIFIDGSGTTEHWFRTTFVDAGGVLAESSSSASFLGEYLDANYSPTSYPEEATFTLNDRYVIDRVRNFIGDPRELTRDYVSSDTGYSSISHDEHTLTLSNPKGWPLSVTLDDVVYTSKEEPRVNDYQFITFSGVEISTTSGTLDVWYYHFRNSDAEILRVYNGLTPPTELTVAQVTFELSAIMTAIEILEKEFRQFAATSGSQVDIFQEIMINPKAGLDARLKDLQALRKRMSDLIDEILDAAGGINADLYGVLID